MAVSACFFSLMSALILNSVCLSRDEYVWNVVLMCARVCRSWTIAWPHTVNDTHCQTPVAVMGITLSLWQHSCQTPYTFSLKQKGRREGSKVNMQDITRYLFSNTSWPFTWIITPPLSLNSITVFIILSAIQSKRMIEVKGKNKLFALELQRDSTVLRWGASNVAKLMDWDNIGMALSKKKRKTASLF